MTINALPTATGSIKNAEALVKGKFGFIVPKDGGSDIFLPKQIAGQAGLLQGAAREALSTATITVVVEEGSRGPAAVSIVSATTPEGESLFALGDSGIMPVRQDEKPATPKRPRGQKPAGVKRRPKQASATPPTPEHTLACYTHASEVDRAGPNERLVVVKNDNGQAVRYLVADQVGKVLRNLGKVTLAEARLAIGRWVEAPRTEPGQKTNDPALSLSMKGKTSGGGKEKKAAS